MKDRPQRLRTLRVNNREFRIASLETLERNERSISRLPYSLRILLENLLRREDGRVVSFEEIQPVVNWLPEAAPAQEINFMPARVPLQDFTGLPAFGGSGGHAGGAMTRMVGEPSKINPLQPAKLVIDHSVQVDELAQRRLPGRSSAFVLGRLRSLVWRSHRPR